MPDFSDSHLCVTVRPFDCAQHPICSRPPLCETRTSRILLANLMASAQTLSDLAASFPGRHAAPSFASLIPSFLHEKPFTTSLQMTG